MHLSGKHAKRVMLGAAAAALFAVPAGSAAGATPTGIYSDFAQCPVNTPVGPDDTLECLVADTTSGAIKLGNENVPINKRIRLQGAFINTIPANETFFGAVNGQTLERTSFDVPGGLSGLMSPSSFGIPLLAFFNSIVNTANGVKATPELVGPVKFNYTNFRAGSGTAITLPLRFKLDNPFLGSNCYVGSSSSPVTLRLTSGRTTGNPPLQGKPGTISFQDGGRLTTATGYSLVDNTFSAPAATGCGTTFIDQPLVTGAVNLKAGLPAPSGKNSAVLNGNGKIADAPAVKASSH